MEKVIRSVDRAPRSVETAFSDVPPAPIGTSGGALPEHRSPEHRSAEHRSHQHRSTVASSAHVEAWDDWFPLSA